MQEEWNILLKQVDNMSRASSTVAVVDASEKMKDFIMHLISYSIKETTEQIASSTCWDPLQTMKYNKQEREVIFILP